MDTSFPWQSHRDSVCKLVVTSIPSRDVGNSLVVQWLGLQAFTAEGLGSIPVLGTKILQAAWQKKKKNHKEFISYVLNMWSLFRCMGNEHLGKIPPSGCLIHTHGAQHLCLRKAQHYFSCDQKMLGMRAVYPRRKLQPQSTFRKLTQRGIPW